MSSCGAREAIITHARRLLRARRRRRLERALYEARSSRSSRSRRSARATPSSPATWPPATAGGAARGCLRFAVACGAESTQHFGAGVSIQPREVERLEATSGSRSRRSSNSSSLRARASLRTAAGSGSRVNIRGGGANVTSSSVAEPRMPHGDRDRPGKKGRRATASTTSRSCPLGARATPTTSTSPGRSGPTASSSRCSPRRWTASSRPRPRG